MLRLFSAAALIMLLVQAALAQKTKVLLAPVVVLDNKILSEMTKNESLDEISKGVEAYLAEQLHKMDAELIKAVQTEKLVAAVRQLGKKPAETLTALVDLQQAAAADYVVVVHVERWSQRNRSLSESSGSPNLMGSETKATVRVWLYGGPHKELFGVTNGSKLEGLANGQYIGTTNRRDMSGHPEDVSRAIRLVNKQKIILVGKATWNAIKPVAERALASTVSKS